MLYKKSLQIKKKFQMIFLNGKIFFTDKLSNKIDKKTNKPH